MSTFQSTLVGLWAGYSDTWPAAATGHWVDAVMDFSSEAPLRVGAHVCYIKKLDCFMLEKVDQVSESARILCKLCFAPKKSFDREAYDS